MKNAAIHEAVLSDSNDQSTNVTHFVTWYLLYIVIFHRSCLSSGFPSTELYIGFNRALELQSNLGP